MELLAESGVHQLGYRSIAREVGLSPGTVAYYFSSRDELLEAVLERHHERFATLAEPLLRMPPELVHESLGGLRGLVRLAFIRVRLARRWSSRLNDSPLHPDRIYARSRWRKPTQKHGRSWRRRCRRC